MSTSRLTDQRRNKKWKSTSWFCMSSTFVSFWSSLTINHSSLLLLNLHLPISYQLSYFIDQCWQYFRKVHLDGVMWTYSSATFAQEENDYCESNANVVVDRSIKDESTKSVFPSATSPKVKEDLLNDSKLTNMV